jgi:hypothetical protein
MVIFMVPHAAANPYQLARRTHQTVAIALTPLPSMLRPPVEGVRHSGCDVCPLPTNRRTSTDHVDRHRMRPCRTGQTAGADVLPAHSR